MSHLNELQDPTFDEAIGRLDFDLSMMMIFAKQAEKGKLSEPNRQTLKHHAEDMEAAAKAIFSKLGLKQEGIPQPEKGKRDAETPKTGLPTPGEPYPRDQGSPTGEEKPKGDPSKVQVYGPGQIIDSKDR